MTDSQNLGSLREELLLTLTTEARQARMFRLVSLVGVFLDFVSRICSSLSLSCAVPSFLVSARGLPQLNTTLGRLDLGVSGAVWLLLHCEQSLQVGKEITFQLCLLFVRLREILLLLLVNCKSRGKMAGTQYQQSFVFLSQQIVPKQLEAQSRLLIIVYKASIKFIELTTKTTIPAAKLVLAVYSSASAVIIFEQGEMRGKKKMNLQIDCEQVSEMEKSIFSEIGSDGLRFLRQDLHIGPEGIMKINGELIPALLPTSKEKLEFGEVLGRGSACVVEQGVYSPLNIPVAIKSINVYDQQKRHQIMNDIRVLLGNLIDEQRSGYKCSFIVTLYGAYFDQGKVKVILELMDAGSLQNIIALFRAAKVAPEIDEGVLAKVALQMLCGLSYLHSKNQLHRDIKPANVLLNSQGQLKLSDFGISRELPEEVDFSKTAVGTRSYMSPERIEGGRYSFKSDVWGLGLILYELASARFPYDSKTEFDLRRDFEKVGTPELPSHYSESFQDFINCALAIREEDRWTASELLGHRWLLASLRPKCSLKRWLQSLKEQILPLVEHKR